MYADLRLSDGVPWSQTLAVTTCVAVGPIQRVVGGDMSSRLAAPRLNIWADHDERVRILDMAPHPFLQLCESLLSNQVLREDALPQALGEIQQKGTTSVARRMDVNDRIDTYVDDDPDNHSGPVGTGVFLACWDRAGKPADLFSLNERDDAKAI